MSEFPLLRLDQSSLFNVFACFDTIRLFNISLCSQKSFNLAQQFLQEKQRESYFSIELKATIRFSVQIVADRAWTEFSEIFCKNLQDSCLCPTRLNDGEMKGIPYLETHAMKDYGGRYDFKMITYWADEYEGSRLFIEHFVKLYNSPELELRIDVGYPSLLETLDLLNSVILRMVHISCSSEQKAPFSSVLDRLKSAKWLEIPMRPEAEFIENDTRQYNHDLLMLYNASWVTRRHLLEMNCKKLFVGNSSFSSEDVNWFLKEWVKGAWPRMEQFLLGMKFDEFNMPGSIEGINVRESIVHHNDFGRPTLDRGLTIERNDGKMILFDASIPIVPLEDEYIVLTMQLVEDN